MAFLSKVLQRLRQKIQISCSEQAPVTCIRYFLKQPLAETGSCQIFLADLYHSHCSSIQLLSFFIPYYVFIPCLSNSYTLVISWDLEVLLKKIYPFKTKNVRIFVCLFVFCFSLACLFKTSQLTIHLTFFIVKSHIELWCRPAGKTGRNMRSCCWTWFVMKPNPLAESLGPPDWKAKAIQTLLQIFAQPSVFYCHQPDWHVPHSCLFSS